MANIRKRKHGLGIVSELVDGNHPMDDLYGN
jgi:hypothetical protein